MKISLLIFFSVISTAFCKQCFSPALKVQGFTDELVNFSISNNQFNKTENENNYKVFNPTKFRARVEGAPAVPPWLTYFYSQRYKKLFFYGKPNTRGSFCIQVTGIDVDSYVTSTLHIQVEVLQQARQDSHGLQIKVMNLNIDDFLVDSRRADRFLDVFRKSLWTECAADVKIVDLDSALNHGTRRITKSKDDVRKEGIVVHIRSAGAYSERLMKLDQELVPIRKLFDTCIHKRTREEQEFRSALFLVDWCGFKLVQSTPTRNLDNLHNYQHFKHQCPTKREKTTSTSDRLLVVLSFLIPMLLIITYIIIIFCLLRNGDYTSIAKIINTKNDISNNVKERLIMELFGKGKSEVDRRNSIASSQLSRASSVNRQIDKFKCLGNRREIGGKLYNDSEVASIYSGTSRAVSPSRDTGTLTRHQIASPPYNAKV